MNAPAAHSPNRLGFTLVELLVVISVMAVLAGILLPVIAVVRRAASNANTEGLIARIETACATYRQEQQVYPPDYVPAGKELYYEYTNINVGGFQKTFDPSSEALPPEALYYYLTNPFVASKAAYLQVLAGGETADYNKNRLPEIVDSWGRPILYNRAKFVGTTAFNYAEDTDGKPWHNKDSFDLYSLGPDGTTNGKDSIPDAASNLATFVSEAVGEHGGTEDDDISNW